MLQERRAAFNVEPVSGFSRGSGSSRAKTNAYLHPFTSRMFSEAELERLRRFPREISQEELVRFFTLTPADLGFIKGEPGTGWAWPYKTWFKRALVNGQSLVALIHGGSGAVTAAVTPSPGGLHEHPAGH